MTTVSDGSGTPLDEAKFVADWARTLTAALESDRLEEFGNNGRNRAVEKFSWESIATRTLEVYKKALAS